MNMSQAVIFRYIDNLNSSVGYDVAYARQVLEDLKPLVNDSYNNSDYLQKARKYGHFTGYKN